MEIDNKQAHLQTHIAKEEMYFDGNNALLPSANDLKKYEKLTPGSAERILRIVEKELKIREAALNRQSCFDILNSCLYHLRDIIMIITPLLLLFIMVEQGFDNSFNDIVLPLLSGLVPVYKIIQSLQHRIKKDDPSD